MGQEIKASWLLGPRTIAIGAALAVAIPAAAFSSNYLVWIVVSPLLSVWAYQLDGIFIGATRSAEMRNAMLASVALYVLAMATLPGLLGNHGLWLSVMIFMVVRALTLAIFYPRIEHAVAGNSP